MIPNVHELQASYDLWNRISLLLTFFTALVALFYFVSTKITNDKSKRLVEAKDQQIAENLKEISKQQQKTAEAQKEAAEAQLELKKYIEQVSKRQEPRRLDFQKFTAALKEKPVGKAEIMYQREDPEASMFSWQIWEGLFASEWQVSQPTPIPANTVKADLKNAPPGIRDKFPAIVLAGG